MTSFRFRCIGLLAALWVSWGQGDAFAQKIYWTDVLNHKIQRADVDCLRGTNPSACIETVLDTLSVVPGTYTPDGLTLTHPGAKSPNSVKVDASRGCFYWSDFWTGVHRTTMNGLSTQTIVPTPAQAIDPSWGLPVCMPNDAPGCRNDPRYPWESTRLLRADIQGIALGLANQVLYFGPDHPFESPLGSKYLNPYPNTFAGGRIRRINLDSFETVDLLSKAVDGFPGSLGLDLSPNNLDLNRNKMYWGSPTSGYYPHPNRLMRANLDGTNVETFLLLDGSSGPWLDPRDIAVDEAAGWVYFTTAYVNSIWRVKVDGTGLTKLIDNLDTPENIVLDAPNNKMYFAEVYSDHQECNGEKQECDADGLNCRTVPNCYAVPDGGAVSRANLDGSGDRGGYERLVSQLSFPLGTFTSDFPFAPNGIGLDLRPSAKAGANPSSGDASLTVNFSSAGSSDPELGSLTYSWTFGEGDLSNDLNNSSESNPAHTYSTPGTYTAKLVVTDISGQSSSAPVTITVTAPNQPPVAKAALTTSSGLTASFSSAGSSDPEGGVLTYSWTFGDNESSTDVTPSHAYSGAGTYTVTLVVTDNKQLASQPASFDITVTVAATPADLIVSTLVAPTSAAAGANISVTETTKNQGTVQAAPSTTRIYFSLDALLDPTDIQFRDRSVGILNAGSSYPGPTPFTFTIPAGTPPGTHYLISVADATGSVSELNETNNKSTKPITVVVPDLIVSGLSAPSTVTRGIAFTVTDTTKNQGTVQAAKSMTYIYFSEDTKLDEFDTFLGRREVGTLNSGSSSSISTTLLPIPTTALPGTRYLIVVADFELKLAETSELNNTRTKSIFVAGPDLEVTSLSAPTSALRGATITVTDTTKNRGTEPAKSPSKTRYYWSADNVLGIGDTPMIDSSSGSPASRDVGALLNGVSETGSVFVKIPADAVAGRNYYIIARSDDFGGVQETDENDNNRAFRVTAK